tara:strand:+ start:148 stop:507 length:360 start_codon:yes stop_codon:yes gene_type:complete
MKKMKNKGGYAGGKMTTKGGMSGGKMTKTEAQSNKDYVRKTFSMGMNTRMTNDMPMENRGYAAGRKVVMGKRAKGGMAGGKMTTKGGMRGGKMTMKPKGGMRGGKMTMRAKGKARGGKS